MMPFDSLLPPRDAVAPATESGRVHRLPWRGDPVLEAPAWFGPCICGDPPSSRLAVTCVVVGEVAVLVWRGREAAAAPS
jgi:hypothetical protein